MACDQRGPLTRSGHSQPDRALREREPDYFRIDERDSADLILFGRRFAKHLRYYDRENADAGDWTAFFDNDISTTLAGLVKAPVESTRRTLADVRRFLEADPARPPDQLMSHFSLLLQLPLALYRECAVRQAALASEHPLYPVLQRLAERDVGPALANLARYHKGAVSENLIQDQPLDAAHYHTAGNEGPGPRLTDEIAAFVLPPNGAAFSAAVLPSRAVQTFAPDGWAAFYTDQDADTAPYADGADAYGQIFDALNYNLLVAATERLFQAVTRMQREAEGELQKSLEAFASHRPHYSLWLAFLSMFDVARGELNRFTERHLDFYYEEVLRLSRRAAVPDQVHVLAELARGRSEHRLAKGTELRGGKDALDREVFYALDDDLVVNRASVRELRGIRVEEHSSLGLPMITVRAASVIASADGAGEEDLSADTPHFAPFGPEGAPLARIGFAVADRQLFQRDGDREIRLSFSVAVPGVLPSVPGFSARLSTAEGWLELHGKPGLRVSLDAKRLRFTVRLNGGDPAIVPIDPALHGDDYDAGLPVLEVLVAFTDPPSISAAVYGFLRDMERGPILLQTAGSTQRTLSVVTEEGTADPAAKFMPFGPRPRRGAYCIIGSSEAFARALDSLTVTVQWAEPYSKDGYFRNLEAGKYTVAFDYLVDGVWSAGSADQSALGLGAAGASTISARGIAAAAVDTGLTLDEPAFDARSRSGFLRMTLQEDFGHARFTSVQTQALIAKATGDTSFSVSGEFNAPDGLPREPYVPQATGIMLSYLSKEQEAARSYRVHPFGVERADGAGRLFPELTNAGALFVGVADLDPPQRLALLMQVADGTGNPLLERPELEFAWLGAEGWQPFLRQQVDDRTDSLAASGVMSFAVPQSAATTSSQMPTGLHWLRITATANAAAVNRLLSVDAQAVCATFVDRGNDPAFLETALPARSISKPRVPDPAIRKFEQPYSSTGGRGREDQSAFHRRVSERLRHKDRAVTMWDYEHLVLESLPQVYRAKALQHTQLVRQDGTVSGDNELSPGAVTVVAVPYTQGREHIDPLRPYADQATLAAIEDTLGRRCSPFVRLEAANARFEEIQVAMNVAFLPGIADTDFYRAEIERALIEQLTPWRRQEGRGAEFNGRIYKSAVIDFVEELPYVDYLQDVYLYHRPEPELAAWTPVDAEVVRATTARSILVSARSHEIGLVS